MLHISFRHYSLYSFHYIYPWLLPGKLCRLYGGAPGIRSVCSFRSFPLRQLRPCFRGSGSVPCSFLAAFKGKMPLLRRKDPAGVLYHGADSRIGCCLVVYRYDLSVMSLQGILLGLILLIVSLTDLHSWIIPDRLHVAGVLVFLATTVFMPDPLHNILRGLLLGIALGGGMLVLSLLLTASQEKKAWAEEILNYFL